ncbi:putative gamma-glutamylcyclotransferase CG2811 [Glossina fuscipes fuscipes]
MDCPHRGHTMFGGSSPRVHRIWCHNVEGEVYEVDEEMLKKLDKLEEYPEYYDREIQEIRMEKKDEVEKCWLYLMRNCSDHLLQKPLLKYEYCSIPTTVAQNFLIDC